MYQWLEKQAREKNLSQTLRALPFAMEKHKGQFRKGSEHIPYIVHPLTVACHAMSLGLVQDDLIASLLLHDVCEDCGVIPEELPAGDTVKKVVSLVTFDMKEGESREQAKQRYFETIARDDMACFVKILDRCNNISTMAGVFSHYKLVDYMEETEKYIMPLLEKMIERHSEYNDALFVVRYQMRSVLDSIRALI